MTIDHDVAQALNNHYDREPVARLVEDEQDEQGVWMPAGLPVFKPGDRVRVHLSAECRTARRPGWECDVIGHSPDEEGLIGVIADEDAPPFCYWPSHTFEGHPYVVDFGRPVLIDGTYSYGAMYYAPSELLPLAGEHGAGGEWE